MITVFDDAQRAHDPQFFLSSGAQFPCPEKPARVDALLAAVRALGCPIVQAPDAGIDPIRAVHPQRYLTFLQGIYARWSRIEGASTEVIPNIHPANRTDGYPKSAVGQAGFHMTDTSCPISAQTWGAAYASAQTAIHAADLVLAGQRAVYGLCRPPGHHAFAELAGGFCYLNNSGIAAQRLTDAGRRVAILDVDLHHGNGTQGMFYDRGDVLTVSIHADPERFYPFFWGYADEVGTGDGLGANLNLPLPRGTGDDGFMAALATAMDAITAWGADSLVLALGLDAYEGDPFAGLGVTTAGFARIGQAVADMGLPTVIIQEGGYLCPELGENLKAVLGRFA
ncbi:MAG: acetylpolyamine aminohydrolase [Rhodobacterales bacterium RIFCSPHIGHO2_02_FULL_62_130]|nr:MAG: acetylpolyamine aminohydrolase [Rhodobacterales bacterium RIFCSPHIGHO2_02_FULL_62_130]OHC57072.1 MAG: acetylpolyamine aminohydrolase [Rhodobacterales bacterium RIFCSPHIGHO2_12_FULL_62_75]HCZ00029.1 acetylpolyamine amidohydrolase [Rhodobacter sp.]